MSRLVFAVLFSLYCCLAIANEDFPVIFTQNDIDPPDKPCSYEGPTQINAKYVGNKVVATIITGFSGGSIAKKPIATNTERNFVLQLESYFPQNVGTLCLYTNKLEIEFIVPEDVSFKAEYLYFMKNGVVRSHARIR